MVVNIYEETVINDFRTRYNYRLFTNNKVVVNRASEIVTDF